MDTLLRKRLSHAGRGKEPPAKKKRSWQVDEEEEEDDASVKRGANGDDGAHGAADTPTSTSEPRTSPRNAAPSASPAHSTSSSSCSSHTPSREQEEDTISCATCHSEDEVAVRCDTCSRYYCRAHFRTSHADAAMRAHTYRLLVDAGVDSVDDIFDDKKGEESRRREHSRSRSRSRGGQRQRSLSRSRSRGRSEKSTSKNRGEHTERNERRSMERRSRSRSRSTSRGKSRERSRSRSCERRENSHTRSSSRSRSRSRSRSPESKRHDDAQSSSASSASASSSSSHTLSSSPTVVENKRTVFVSNISYECSVRDLREHFRKCGPMVDVRVIKGPDGKSKGSALIEFDTEEGRRVSPSLTTPHIDGLFGSLLTVCPCTSSSFASAS